MQFGFAIISLFISSSLNSKRIERRGRKFLFLGFSFPLVVSPFFSVYSTTIIIGRKHLFFNHNWKNHPIIFSLLMFLFITYLTFLITHLCLATIDQNNCRLQGERCVKNDDCCSNFHCSTIESKTIDSFAFVFIHLI